MEASRKKPRAPNPKSNTGFLSVVFFAWVWKIFRLDHKKNIELSDIWGPLPEDTSEVLGDCLEKKWKEEQKRAESKKAAVSPNLLFSIAKAFKKDLFQLAILHVAFLSIDILLRPYLLAKLLLFFQVEPTDEGGSNHVKTDAIYFGIGLLGSIIITTLLFNHYSYKSWIIGMRIRAACVSLVYRKTLKLRTLGDASAGQIVNLVSNDVSRFEFVVFMLHYLWSAPIQTVVIGYFVYQEVGVAGLAGLVVICIVAPIQTYTAKLTSRFRYQTAYKTDERIRLTDEIINGIHVIKMFAWEKPFIKFLDIIRRLELRVVRKTGHIRGIYMMFNLFTTRMALYCTLLTFVFMGHKLTAAKVFVIVAYFGMISMSMTSLFVRGLAEVAECMVSVKRIQKFMLNDEIYIPAIEDKDEEDEKDNKLKSTNTIQAKNVYASWDVGSTDPTLKNINLEFDMGQLVGVIGSVGSGKSSLLNLFLREIPMVGGELKINGKVSYAAQDPWVFAGTIRQNILFGLPYESKRYREVIKVCSLERDIDLFPNGEQTVIGERGASLSGGQKARVNLARAVYKRADIYVLDDPLSAVDTHVGKHLFNDCLRGFLRGKTIVLATHQLQFVKNMDHIITMDTGKISLQGSYEEFSNDIFSGIAPNAEMFSEVVKAGRKRSLIRMVSTRSGKSNSTTGGDDLSIYDADATPADKPVEAFTTYKGSAFLGYIRAGMNPFTCGLIIFLMVVAQISASMCDYWVAYWTNIHEREFGNGTIHTGMDSYKIVYTTIISTLFISALLRGLVFYTLCSYCSQGLHTSMAKCVIGTDLSFFHKNPSGGILNRFSKDLGAVDESLPKILLDFCQTVGQVAGAVMTSLVVNIWFLIPISIFTSLTVFLRGLYIKTSKNLKRLENMSRSPVFSHLNTSLHGMTTIRAHGAQNYLKAEFDLHQDLNITTTFTFLGAQQGYAYSLDILGTIYMSFVILSFVTFDTGAYGGDVGLAITQTMIVTFLLQWSMKQSSDLVNLMTSLERLLAFTKLHPEEKNLAEKKLPPPGWPEFGEIEFKELSLWYENDEPPVISNLNIRIKPGEKIGIVGRTGAGKSSIVASLFRLTDISGDVFIDGVSSNSMPLESLRSKISIIPQDPILFFGTIRRNLDPFGEHPDFILWRALEEVELKDVFKEGLGLENKVNEGGSNLSVGQRQLLCLARAMLRNNKIIILDEATANVDPKTDSLIQTTIQKKFGKFTVITIAHRLHTVMESDRIMVMDAGLLVECDSPHLLLQTKGGYFYNLVQETGHAMASQLTSLAEKHYLTTRQESLESTNNDINSRQF